MNKTLWRWTCVAPRARPGGFAGNSVLLSLGRIKCTWPNTVEQNFATVVIQWTLVVFVVLGVVFLVLVAVVACHYFYYH